MESASNPCRLRKGEDAPSHALSFSGSPRSVHSWRCCSIDKPKRERVVPNFRHSRNFVSPHFFISCCLSDRSTRIIERSPRRYGWDPRGTLEVREDKKTKNRSFWPALRQFNRY